MAGAALATVTAGAAYADTVLDDPLHGQCVAGGVLCQDNGTTTTISTGTGFSGAQWGFTISPGPQGPGQFDVVIAVPNNLTPPTSIAITGTINGVSIGSIAAAPAGTWTSGKLGNQTTISGDFPSASPANPIDNFLPSTQKNQASATGYDLFVADLGSQILEDNSTANTATGVLADMDLSANLPTGTMIFGFFDGSNGWVATASSGVLWVDGNGVSPPPPPPPPVPEPSTLALLGAGLLGLGMVSTRRRNP